MADSIDAVDAESGTSTVAAMQRAYAAAVEALGACLECGGEDCTSWLLAIAAMRSSDAAFATFQWWLGDGRRKWLSREECALTWRIPVTSGAAFPGGGTMQQQHLRALAAVEDSRWQDKDAAVALLTHLLAAAVCEAARSVRARHRYARIDTDGRRVAWEPVPFPSALTRDAAAHHQVLAALLEAGADPTATVYGWNGAGRLTSGPSVLSLAATCHVSAPTLRVMLPTALARFAAMPAIDAATKWGVLVWAALNAAETAYDESHDKLSAVCTLLTAGSPYELAEDVATYAVARCLAAPPDAAVHPHWRAADVVDALVDAYGISYSTLIRLACGHAVGSACTRAVWRIVGFQGRQHLWAVRNGLLPPNTRVLLHVPALTPEYWGALRDAAWRRRVAALVKWRRKRT